MKKVQIDYELFRKKELQIDSVKIGNKWFWMLQEE